MISESMPARSMVSDRDEHGEDVSGARNEGALPWSVHTGPFPLIVGGRVDQLWLWRITNDEHFTAVVVVLTDAVLIPEDDLSSTVADAVATRGQSAVKACLNWSEPPREITFSDPVGRPTYWGGHP